MTKRVMNERKLQAAMARLRIGNSVFESTRDAVIIADAGGLIMDVNPAFTAVTGYSREQSVGRHIRFLDSGLTSPSVFAEMQQHLETKEHWVGEVLNRHRHGSVEPEYMSITKVVDLADSKTFHHVVVVSRLNQLRDDVLTGFPGRILMSHRIAQSISECQGTGLSMALMLLTVDQLRTIHEAYGVTQSDLLLRQVADRLRALESQSQRVYAIGKNEFGIIFSPTRNIESINAFADKLLNIVATPFQLQSEPVHISLSVGIALCPEDSSTAEALMDNAHQALISAQDEGGGQANYFEPQRRQQAHLRHRLISDLKSAAADDKLGIVYQPIIDLQTGRLQKAEALIRWRHPEFGQVSPADFIPLAEQNGALIKVIEEWVFHQVFAALRDIRQRQPHFQMSINLSPVHLLHKDFNVKNVTAQLREHGVPGDAVVLEMTEGIMMEMNDALHQRLKALKDSGIQLAIDDFGTGYSSLSYLHQFDFQLLKIDQSFVRTLSPKSRNAALCEAIISMGHALGMQVVAEGIETQEQFDFFAQRGCDFGQGYFISHPLPLKELALMLSEGAT